MSTNHKWNVLNIMRFYNRINKPFNAEIYIRFISPDVSAHTKPKYSTSWSEIQEILREHMSEELCQRRGEHLTITLKGLTALSDWETKTQTDKINKRQKDYVEKGLARPLAHGPDGKWLPGGRNPRKQKKQVQK